MTADRMADLEALGIEWKRRHQEKWEDMYHLAELYFMEHGDLHVPCGYVTSDGKKLGLWIKHQRDKHNMTVGSTLTQQQTESLEALGIQWRLRNPPLPWIDWFHAAKEFYQSYGHLQVHSDYVDPLGRRVGLWVKIQRYRGKAGLEKEQVRLLDSIGMEWNIKDRKEWDSWYDKAAAYVRENGELPKSKAYVTREGDKLGIWLSVQRERYHSRTKKPLTREQIKKLEALGMHWNPLETRWEKLFEMADSYYQEHGDLLVPQSYTTAEGIQLGRWIAQQRHTHHQKKLSPEKKERLDEIGMVWEPTQQAWDKMMQRARTYYAAHGDLQVPQNYVTEEGDHLGIWICGQRIKYKEGKLKQVHIQQLEALEMIWDPTALRDQEWRYMYDQVKNYWETHGAYPTDPALKASNGKSMRGWYYQQKRDLRKTRGKMTAQRKKLLAEIGIKEGGAEQMSA